MRRAALLLAASSLVGCVPALRALPDATPAVMVPVEVTTQPLTVSQQPCIDQFQAHELDHITTLPTDAVRMFEANGTGVAINDLDDDGDLDMVLANHAGPNTLLWNEGGLRFRTERLPDGNSRAVNLVDVDGDDRVDVVTTRRLGAPNLLRNTGEPLARWEPTLLEGVAKPAYAMTWGDIDGDNDLDLMTGAYDAELLAHGGDTFLMGDGAGVYSYEQRDGRWIATRLASKSQALAIAWLDLDRDGQRDLLIGNDFAPPDQVWLRDGGAWQLAQPFRQTSHSTMSFDWADVDNNGSFELFATDMKPPSQDVATLARWRPMMAEMWHPQLPGDPQIMENSLQVWRAGAFRNEAYRRGVDATGWSWSGKFGDFDNDGAVDLYVVNGMIEHELFGYLPEHELAEPNQALRNDGSGYFVRAPGWMLGSMRSGRGLGIADLDSDGDLDLVVNNVRTGAQLFENRLCSGTGLEVDLRWRGSGNTRALGAVLTLDTTAGRFTRDVSAGSGYLSGDPSRVHFGIPRGATVRELTVEWPDGARSTVAAEGQSLVTIARQPATGTER